MRFLLLWIQMKSVRIVWIFVWHNIEAKDLFATIEIKFYGKSLKNMKKKCVHSKSVTFNQNTNLCIVHTNTDIRHTAKSMRFCDFKAFSVVRFTDLYFIKFVELKKLWRTQYAFQWNVIIRWCCTAARQLHCVLKVFECNLRNSPGFKHNLLQTYYRSTRGQKKNSKLFPQGITIEVKATKKKNRNNNNEKEENMQEWQRRRKRKKFFCIYKKKDMENEHTI